MKKLLTLFLALLGLSWTMEAQEIGTWPGFKSGAATFTFLQNAPCHVTYVAPLFDSKGYTASFYLTTSTVTNWSDWQTLANNGHEIGSFGMSGSSPISASELTGSKSAINSHITGKSCITVSYPNCQVPSDLTTLEANYIAGSNCTWSGEVMGSNGPTNWYEIPKILTGSEGFNSTAQLTSKMQSAISSKGWVVFMTYGLQGKENGYATYSPTSADVIPGALTWAETNGNIWISSLRNVAMYIKERNASTFALQSKTSTAATYTLTHSIADAVCEYDYPLSLRIPLSGWTDIEVRQNGDVIPHTVEGDYIYFDAVPNDGNIVVSHAASVSGTCGANVNWELNDGVLTISGTGPMKEYGSLNALPWYDWRSSIISVIVENGVTSISGYVCYSYTALEEVTIGNSVTSIGDFAFDGCTSLNSLTIGHSVTTIGKFAFNGCTVLPEISLPNSLTTIGQSAFNGCAALTEVTIGDNVTSIGEDAFKKCTALEEVTIGDKVESIGDEAFNDCEAMTSLTMGNSVTSIGRLAFFYCSALTSLTLPASLTTIGENGFKYCYSLTEITCNATTPPTCGSDALANISTTIPVYVPYGTKSAYKGADEWKNFTNIKASVSGTCGANVNWVLDEGVLTISGTGEMDDYASEDEVPWFPYVSTITNVVIEDGVTHIGNNACYACTALEEVTIGNSVTSIGDLAFRYCEALITITLPENLTSIGNEAFDGCTLLQEVTIPNSVTFLGAGAFRNCSSLNAVTIGSGITTIEQETFASCGLLYEVTIPDNIVVIGEDAFNYCQALTSLTIGNSVTTIGTAAFSACYGLTSITIPESVVSIDYHAFYHCEGLTEITCKPTMPPTCASNAFDGVDNSIPVYVPYGSLDAYAMAEGWNYFTGIQLKVDAYGSCGESVNWLLTDGLLVISGSGAMTNFASGFEVPWSGYNPSITRIIIEDGVTSIGDFSFIGCTSLTNVTIPNSVTSIGERAFEGCDALTTISLPDGLTTIGNNTFALCDALISITIPASVTTIGNYAFQSCTGLTQITCEATTPPSLGDDVFLNLDNSIPVYVPAEAVNTYKETEGWNYFSNILGYASGTCGASATWTLYGDVLTISGTGQMTNYSYASSRPWHAYAASITTVIVEDGITSIGESAFDGFTALTSATIGNTVEYIYGFAFIGCTALTEITLPSSLTDIYPSAFKYAGFTSLLIPENVIYIGNEAFSSCEALTEITSTATTPPSCSSTAFNYVNDEIPGTYLIDWFVRSTDKNGEAISEWAQGESFEVTIKEPQGIEDVNADANTTVRKEMRNGLLYIIRGDRTYDSNGRLIQ